MFCGEKFNNVSKEMITYLGKVILWPQKSLDKHKSPVEHFY